MTGKIFAAALALPFLAVALGCNDSTPLQAADDPDLGIAANTAGNPHNPFVGSWWGIDWEDNSLHRLTISHGNAFGDVQINLRDEADPICDGGPVRVHVTGRIVAEHVLKMFDVVSYCHGGDPIGPYPDVLGYEYVPALDELRYCYVPEEAVVFCVMNLTRDKSSS